MPETTNTQTREALYRTTSARALVTTAALALKQRLGADARDEHLTLAAALDDLTAAQRALNDVLSAEAGL